MFNLRFRTRLVLVMFVTMACTSAILVWTYIQENKQIKAYVSGVTSDLLTISQATQQQVAPTGDQNQALQAYMKTLEDAGFSSVTVADPTGAVVASTDPAQSGKKIKIPKRRPAQKPTPITVSAEFKDVDVESNSEPRTYSVQFPIIRGDKVIGYLQARGLGDQVGQLVRHAYATRLGLIIATMLTALLAVVYLAFRFTKPVDMLVEGAHQIASGNLYVSLPATGTDEMGRLAKTFNEMVERLRQNRELQERLNEAEKTSLLGRFAATVAHEVRNSLNFINLSIDQIRAKHGGGEDRAARDLQRNLANMKEEVSRLNRLVNEFLSAGRQSPPKLAACDVSAMLQDSVTLVEKQARSQEIEIVTGLEPEMPEIEADAAQMKTCFSNILTNAVQAMPHGGRIRITTHRVQGPGRPDSLEIRFADTGPGIPSEDREKVFAPYFSTKTTGFGLGLAITRKIVEDHGGRIYVRAGDAPGTEMVVTLPLAHAATAVSEAARSPAA
ncbi:MAG TPA: ATP-binding protein [Terriglobia bacterium]|nr:ATP-binding protein [Terriglobia bacterium]